ncbi:MAG: branched-chain amino acid ABC transporter permease [Chthoniobacterales bacterium]
MRDWSKFALLGAILVSLLVSQFIHLDPYFSIVVVNIGINIILAVSLNLVNGYTGQFSLGHAGFMAIGAYTSAAITSFGGPRWFDWLGGINAFTTSTLFVVALIVGGLAAALAGLVIGVPSLRLKGDYLAIATLGFGEIIRVIIQNTDAMGGSRGFSVSGIYTTIFWTYSVAAITIYVVVNLVHSAYGRGFLTVRDDEIAAEAIGVNTTKYKVVAFVLASFFAGIAGGLYAHFIGYLTPEGFGFMKSIEIIVMVILGGMGNTVGVIFAAILLTILPEVLRPVQQYRMVIYSLMLIILMLTRPQGLFGGLTWRRSTSWLRRKKIPLEDGSAA